MNVTVTSEQDALPIDEESIALEGALIAERAGYRGELSIALVTDEAIRRLNREFLDHDYATDVLAFPLGDGEGEVVVSVERAAAEAADRGFTTISEVMLYVAHGILHLAGWDDREPDEARRMQEEAVRILAELGYENR